MMKFSTVQELHDVHWATAALCISSNYISNNCEPALARANVRANSNCNTSQRNYSPAEDYSESEKR